MWAVHCPQRDDHIGNDVTGVQGGKPGARTGIEADDQGMGCAFNSSSLQPVLFLILLKSRAASRSRPAAPPPPGPDRAPHAGGRALSWGEAFRGERAAAAGGVELWSWRRATSDSISSISYSSGRVSSNSSRLADR